MTPKLSNFLSRIILAISLLLIGLLTVMLVSSQAYMTMTKQELISFVNHPWYFFPIVLMVLAGFFISHKLLERLPARWIYAFFTLIYLIGGAYLISHVEPELRADAASVYEAALNFNHGDYSQILNPSGYLYTYPFQLGLLTLNTLYLKLSQDISVIFWVNLAYVLLINGILYKLTLLLTKSQLASKYTLLFAFLFFPHFFFILFAYGTLPGLAALMVGFYLLSQYLSGKPWPYLLGGAIFLSLAAIIRNNYQIFLIVVLALAILQALQLAQWKKLLVPVVVITMFIAGSKGLNTYYSQRIGQPVPEGIPMLSYLTMGISESKNINNPGWYTGYNKRILKTNDYNQEAAKKQALADLQTRLDEFRAQPDLIWDFFSRKIRSTWTEPTFQSLWSGPLADKGQETSTPFLQDLYGGGKTYQVLTLVGGVLLFLIYGLNVVWLIQKLLSPNSLTPLQLYGLIFFIGGFLFHLLWETKSQYVSVYVFLLLPTAAQGLTTVIEGFNNGRANS